MLKMGWVSAVAMAGALGLSGCSAGSTAAGGGGGTTAQPAVTVSGAAATRLGATTQFSAAVTGSSSTAVTWQVNGIAGGSAATGTISAAGLYSAPAALPVPNTVTVGAVLTSSTSVSGTLTEAVWNPLPVMTSEAATQTGTSGAVLVDVQGTGFVSGAAIQVGGVFSGDDGGLGDGAAG